jgi:hypothetical protein
MSIEKSRPKSSSPTFDLKTDLGIVKTDGRNLPSSRLCNTYKSPLAPTFNIFENLQNKEIIIEDVEDPKLLSEKFSA